MLVLSRRESGNLEIWELVVIEPGSFILLVF